MKDKSFDRLTHDKQSGRRRRGRLGLAGDRGARLQPPAYGIDYADQAVVATGSLPPPIQVARDPKRPGALPEDLQSQMEQISGRNLDDVTVHYNSPYPVEVDALAFTQGVNIYIAPGQEAHLPHEAWHVVQQKEGRVRRTADIQGQPLNDDGRLEAEASRVARTARVGPASYTAAAAHGGSRWQSTFSMNSSAPIQRFRDVTDANVVHFANDIPNPPGWAARKAEWLPHFSAVQHFLSNIQKTKPLLDALNKQMKTLSLNEILWGDALQLGWKSNIPKLIEGVPQDEFVDLVRQGYLFEDWVEPEHGVQTHRIQWYLIQKQYPFLAKQLYTELVDSDWKTVEGWTMWDLVVDSSASHDPHDFTHPATLERYLEETYRSSFGWRNRLGRTIREGRDNYYQDRGNYAGQAMDLEQDQQPLGPAVTNTGRWTGWKQIGGPWRPTIFHPN